MADRADRLDRGNRIISRRDAEMQGIPNPEKVPDTNGMKIRLSRGSKSAFSTSNRGFNCLTSCHSYLTLFRSPGGTPAFSVPKMRFR